MKIIPLTDLKSAAKANPQIWHAAFAVGKLDAGGGNVALPDDFPLKATPIPPPVKRTPIQMPAFQPMAVRPADWPLWARIIAKRKKDIDAGLGDTLARIFEGMSADKLAKFYERATGKTCGCTNRQAWLNARFNYSLQKA